VPSEKVPSKPSDLLDAIFPDRARDLSWEKLGYCSSSDPDIFFPGRRSNKSAKALCGKCLVRDECLEYAIETGQNFGVWGGQGVKERRTLREERAMNT